MRRASSLALVGVLPFAAFAAGCGGNQTTASRSAAEFDEAQRKGVTPSGGEAHGQHGEAASTKDGPAAGHGEMPPAHSGHDGGGSSTSFSGSGAGMDHSAMPGMGSQSNAARQPTGTTQTSPRSARGGSTMAGMAGIDHSRTTGVDHANMPGMDHSIMAPPAVGAVPPIPERPAAVASPGQLVSTLRPDELDVPAPTAVREAARAAEMAQQVAGGGHGMSHGTYRQIDAGRDDVAPTPSGHEGHQMTPSPRPTPTPRPKEDNR